MDILKDIYLSLIHFNLEWLFHSIVITLSFIYLIIPLFWMMVYEIRYYKGAGEDYVRYGKDYVKKRYIQLSSGNKGEEK